MSEIELLKAKLKAALDRINGRFSLNASAPLPGHIQAMRRQPYPDKLMNVRKLTDILTEAQARKVLKIYADAKPGTFASECEEKVIVPNIAEINRKTGQENDTKFMAYLCEHLINQRLV